jgi:hypothetical protein
VPQNIYIGLSLEDLEARLAIARDDLEGAIIEASAGDVRGQFTPQGTFAIRQRIEDLLYALNRLDPVKYPPEQIFRDSRTTIDFS